jgi:hypothetical protein
MITSKEVDKRGDIKDWNRSELYERVAQISKTSFEKYAEHVGADHFYSDERVFTKGHGCSQSIMFECLRVIYDPMFDQYDNVLFVDTDIVVNTEENIFDIFEGDVMGVLETDIITDHGGGYGGWDSKPEVFDEYYRKYLANDCPIVPALPPNRPSKLTVLNTGVVMWSREARLRAREVFDDWQDWCYGEPKVHVSVSNDQPFISAQLMKHDFDLQTIDQTWNDSPHYKPYNKFFDVAKFCHYTGGEWKIDMIEHWEKNMYKIKH